MNYVVPLRKGDRVLYAGKWYRVDKTLNIEPRKIPLMCWWVQPKKEDVA